MPILHAADLDLRGKRVLIRLDLNVPLKNGKITSTARIDAALPTIRLAIKRGAQILLMSHLGRPQEGKPDPQLSLKPIAEYLNQTLAPTQIKFTPDYLTHPPRLPPNQIALLENVRFNPGETTNDPHLAKKYAALCDTFIMDAFGTAHRAHASTEGVARLAKTACAGPLLTAEITALGKALKNPRRPLLAIIGGAKVSTKLNILKNLAPWVDHLILGGGIANTFLAAAGHPIGKSLHEPDLIPTARELIQTATRAKKSIPLPQDAIVAKALTPDAQPATKPITQIAPHDMILDLGPQTAHQFAATIAQAKTILWNGPLGAFEYPQFAQATQTIAHAIATSPAYSIAGGGDTLAAADHFNLTPQLSYTSTGGGAFLEFIEGKDLPALISLEARA